MLSALRPLVRDVAPPILVRGTRRLRANLRLEDLPSESGVKPATYYDSVYATSLEYAKPYPESIYYFMWSVVADRLAGAGATRVLDIGCGPGQFAEVLCDRDIKNYLGIDFSATAIAHAKARSSCPSYEFHQSDLTDPRALSSQSYDYDWVTAVEVLEHIEDDRSVIRQIRPGARALLTVPNFADVAHVRFFSAVSEVEDRYREFFADLRVDALRFVRPGRFLFLLEGQRIPAR